MTKIYFILTILALSFFSCSDFVEVDLPGSQLTGATVFEDRTTLNAAMVEVYSKLRDGGLLNGSLEGSAYRLGLYADELDYYGPAGDIGDLLWRNSLIDSEGSVAQTWNSGYNQVYGANAILEGIDGSTALAASDQKQFRGEALFVRALVHFYLTNVYGAIPYITTTDYQQNRLASRLGVDEVYELVIADLTEAISLLPEAYISAERVRPNKSAVYALLARVYLYDGRWAEAADAASAVLNNPEYVWEEDLDKVFLKESTTTIWQFYPRFNGGNTDEGDIFIFNAGPPSTVALSSSLMLSFSGIDQRKTHWTTAVSDGSTTWYHASKYKYNYEAFSSFEYSIVFRLAEQYLIRAEARARQGDLIGAKDDLNKIRNTAGLNNTEAILADDIVEAVLAERQLELFTEYGHRFFDLKRTGKLDVVLPVTKMGWNSTDALWPIPATELLANPNLAPQNAGY